MIQDFRHHENPLEADICIIGAGAAGIALAREFIGGPRKVLVVESGGLDYDTETQALYDSFIQGLPHEGAFEGRARVFGGTTTLWAGQALPLDSFDFDKREWVDNSGWPISKDTLQPYYRRAEEVLNLPPRTYDESSWPSILPSPPNFDQRKIRFLYSQFSPTPNFARAYQDELQEADNVTVLLHANAININMSANGTEVQGITVSSLDGQKATAEATYYVVCCGGIETARLLLASDLPGSDRRIGRYFQEHVHIHVPLDLSEKDDFENAFNTRRVDGRAYFGKIASTPVLQRKHEILNVAADLTYSPGKATVADAAANLIRATSEKDFRRLLEAMETCIRNPVKLLRAVYRYVFLNRKLDEGTGTPHLCFQTESVPIPESRVTLSSETDSLGVPKSILNWQITSQEIRTVKVFAEAVDKELRAAGLGQLDLSVLPNSSNPEDVEDLVHESYHHMGTTRMAVTPQEGVVNEYCCVHGVDNLYVGSSSVFPTGGFSNPTLTILALCLRLADHLKQKLRS